MKWDSAYKVSGRENVIFKRLLSLRLCFCSSFKVQVHEYKQLKESLNRQQDQTQNRQNAPQQPQVSAAASKSNTHETQQATVLEEVHKDEAVHHQEGRQETEPRVTLGSNSDQDVQTTC